MNPASATHCGAYWTMKASAPKKPTAVKPASDLLEASAFDVVLLDVWLPGMDGLDTLQKIRALENPPEVIMISGHGTIETAVRATKLGAYDFLEKPLSIDRTLILIKHAIDAKKLRGENRDLKKQLQSKSVIVGDSIPMKALRQQTSIMAPTNGRVLIYGESGTGKELVAHAIHAQSLRRDEMFVEVNCAAIPEDLIESELFGHRRGLVYGRHRRTGRKVSEGQRGDPVSRRSGRHELENAIQGIAHARRQRFTPVGSSRDRYGGREGHCSTNKDLEEEISKGNFREDLFYRLNVIPFFVPPLRERKEDVPLLARHFLKEFAAAYGRRPREITDEAIRYPGALFLARQRPGTAQRDRAHRNHEPHHHPFRA